MLLWIVFSLLTSSVNQSQAENEVHAIFSLAEKLAGMRGRNLGPRATSGNVHASGYGPTSGSDEAPASGSGKALASGSGPTSGSGPPSGWCTDTSGFGYTPVNTHTVHVGESAYNPVYRQGVPPQQHPATPDYNQGPYVGAASSSAGNYGYNPLRTPLGWHRRCQGQT